MSEFKGAAEGATIQGTVGTHSTTVDANGNIVANPADMTKDIGKNPINKASTSDVIAKIGWSNAPLDTVLRNISKGKCGSDEFRFFSVAARGIACTTTASTVTFDTENKAVTVSLAAGAHNLSKSGLLLVPTVNVDADGVFAAINPKDVVASNPLVLHVVDINYTANTIEVIPTNAKTGTLPLSVEMFRTGVACDQDAAITDDPQIVPTEDSNFCQRQLCTVSENMFQKLQDKDADFNFEDYRDQAIMDFRLQSESLVLFGAGALKGSNFRDPKTMKRKLHMRGVNNFPIQRIVKGESEEIDAFLNRAMEELFAVNNGSSERLLFYGAGFATYLANSKWWTKQLEANKTEMKWGVTWKMVESNFGTLRGIMDPALSLYGPYSNCAFVIDRAHIRLIEQVPMHERKLDLQKAGIRNSQDVVIEEAITLELTNPMAHGLLVIG